MSTEKDSEREKERERGRERGTQRLPHAAHVQRSELKWRPRET